MTTDNKAALELLPCPFCGGVAEIVERDVEPQGDPWYGRKEERFVECNGCGCCLFDGYFHQGFWEEDKNNPVNAITAWNTRAALTAPAVDVEGVRKELVEFLTDSLGFNNAEDEGQELAVLACDAWTEDLIARGLIGNAPQWQPIETAPKDGTRILVRNGNKGGYSTNPYDIGVAEWDGGGFNKTGAFYSIACCDGVSYYKPTHWMPLPQPPQEREDE